MHPWLDGRFAPAENLTPTERIFTFLAANTARGDDRGVRIDWEHLPRVNQGGGLEAILQTHLFAGYPRAINALAAVHRVGVEPGAIDGHGEAPHDQWLTAGESLCATIYGAAYEPLRARMHGLHPALERWMVETGYGRVLSRPGLSPRQRELCVIAVLAGQNVPLQLESHLRGALRVGATQEECNAILSQTEAFWGAEAAAQCRQVWSTIAADGVESSF